MIYSLLLTGHIVSFVAWMAALLYLPRLFVYHTGQAAGSDASALLKTMESRLYGVIMTPAMILTWITGVSLAVAGGHYHSLWFVLKLACVLLLSGFHGFLGRQRRYFANDVRKLSARRLRQLNEVPTLLLIVIVTLVVFKPL